MAPLVETNVDLITVTGVESAPGTHQKEREKEEERERESAQWRMNHDRSLAVPPFVPWVPQNCRNE